jgi:hypothetical protein
VFGPPGAGTVAAPSSDAAYLSVRVPNRPLAGSNPGPQINNHALARATDRESRLLPLIDGHRSSHDVSALGHHAAYPTASYNADYPALDALVTRTKKAAMPGGGVAGPGDDKPGADPHPLFLAAGNT